MRKQFFSRKTACFIFALILVLCVMAPLYALEKTAQSGDSPAEERSFLENAVEVLGAKDGDGAGEAKDDGVRFYEVDNEEVSASLLEQETADTTASDIADNAYQPTDIVRVSIVLEGLSTVEKGYEVMGIAENDAAMSYRQKLSENESRCRSRRP